MTPAEKMDFQHEGGEEGATDAELERQARDWVCRIASGRATAGDARKLARWCARSTAHRTAFARARQQWQDAASVAQLHRGLYPQDAWAPPACPGLPHPGRRAWLVGGVAAAGSVALLSPFGLWPSWQEWDADYRTGAGEQQRVVLDRDVELMLNTRTRLARLASEEGLGVRLLAGEAQLRRADGAPAWAVLASSARVVPVEGSVQVRRDEERYCLTCVEGAAELHHPARQMVLRTGQQVWYDASGAGQIASVDLEQAKAWREGVLAFRATPLAEALAEINRYRSGRVVLTDQTMAHRRLSGHFRIAALDEALVQIEQMFGATLTRLPGGLALLG